MHIPDNIVNEIEDLMYNFLWNGKSHKVKKKVIVQNYINGGCKMIDIKEVMKTQKIKWIKWYFDRKYTYWKNTMKTILGVQNLDLFLKSNYELPSKQNTTSFYYEVLKVWKKVKYDQVKSKEYVLNQYIFHNSRILHIH